MFALLSAFGLEIFAKRFLVSAAVIIAFGAVFTAFTVAIGLLLSTIDYQSVPVWLQSGFQILPSNTDTCFSTIAATKLAAMFYDYQLRIIDYRRS